MKRLLMSSMVLLLMLFTVSTGVFANTDYDAREKLRNEGVWLTPEESAQQKAELDSMLDSLDNSANTLDSLAAPPLTVQINGSAVNAPADMNVIEGQVMVPLSWAAGQLGADSVQWNSATRRVTIKTSQDFYNMEKLASYANALQSSADEHDEQIWPLPDKAKNLDLSYAVPNREWVLNLKQFKPERGGLALPIDRDQINIHITSDDGSYEHSMWVHSIENHQDHYYLPMDWLEYLFKAKVNYDQTTNVLSIQTPDLDKIKSEIALIENTLIPASADEAIKLWGRGEQARNGALQYAALSSQLRQEADKSNYVRQSYWVTGGSSPSVGPITIINRDELSDTKVEYTLSFPEITSNPPYTTATEKMVVEKLLNKNGQEGWYITQILQSSDYGIVECQGDGSLDTSATPKDYPESKS